MTGKLKNQPDAPDEQASDALILVSIPEAARRLSISRSSLYKAILARKIRTVRIGRSRRVPISELSALVDRALRQEDDEDGEPRLIRSIWGSGR